MKPVLARLRALALALVGFGATGCPAVLDDDFTVVSPGAGGETTNGGTAPSMGGNTSGTGGNAGNGETSGAPDQGGSPNDAGTGNSAGMGGVDAGGAGSGGEPGVALPCADCGQNEKCCNDVCVDTRFDPNNCLTCGHGCPGTTCESSSCTNTCQQGFVDCNKNIVDGCEVNPASDPSNCGNCGIVCGFQQECVKGYCVCPTGTADCDGLKENGCEADITSDKNRCNGCGNACAPGQICQDSRCECAVGTLDCNGNPSDGCEAAVTAQDTCGSCSLDCGAHGLCVSAGTCGCAPCYLDCDAQVPGCETPVSDPAHCGSCDVACPANLPACNGTQCTVGCGNLTLCGASCVDTQLDPENCGGCNKPVGANQACVAGKPTCLAGFADCDGAPGCEANTSTDVANCGVCKKACKVGALCESGSCACAPTTPNDCGATCAQCCNDGQCSDGNSCTADVCNAGTCSTGLQCAGGGKCCSGTGCFDCCSDADCSGGMVCTGNQCVNLTCPAPQIVCNSKCVNPTNDPKHCGGCDNNCGPGRTCFVSGCTPKWVATSTPTGFGARERAASAALGSKVFVWGGNDASGKALADGAIYDPSSDTWAAVAATGAPPSARILATAVWTGSTLVVWGGGDVAATADYNTGSRYDPATSTWSAMTTTGAPAGRRGAYGFWTGSRVLIYGGVDRNGLPSSAANLYDPVNDAWSTTTTQGAPAGRTDPVVGWSGSLLFLFGGRPGGNGANDGTYLLDVAANTWTRGSNGPNQRYGAFGNWDGSLFLAWGGANNGLKADGQVYEPVSDKWSGMQSVGVPTGRYLVNRQTGWAARIRPRVSLFVGGMGTTGFLTNGATYNSTTNAWTAVSSWPSGASHLGGVGVWTGTELVLWGGRSGTASALTTAGERYLP